MKNINIWCLLVMPYCSSTKTTANKYWTIKLLCMQIGTCGPKHVGQTTSWTGYIVRTKLMFNLGRAIIRCDKLFFFLVEFNILLKFGTCMIDYRYFFRQDHREMYCLVWLCGSSPHFVLTPPQKCASLWPSSSSPRRFE